MTQNLASSSAPARTALREATHARHVLINRHPMIEGVTRPGFSLEQYRRILVVYYRLYLGLEPVIEAGLEACSATFDYAPRRKLPWLAQDLEHFALPVPAACIALPPGLSEPGVGALLGMLYAIEGSTLGGQVISRHLATHLGLGGDSGARFFSAYGADGGARWHSFLDWAEVVGRDPADLDRACTAACLTFDLFMAALDE